MAGARPLFFASLLLAHCSASEPAWIQELKGRTLPGAAKPSDGCGGGKGLRAWGAHNDEAAFEGWVPFTVLDFVAVNRSFYIQVPSSSLRRGPVPLLIGLHSQGDQADTYANAHYFGSFGSTLGFVSVYPQGLDDAVPGGGDLGTGWNVGTAGDDQTCVADEVTPDCYASCWEQGKCGQCNWSGCYDERLFIYSVIQAINSVLCIDQSRIYVTGESNGGMMAHYLVQSLPGTFAAVAPWYGLPLLGYGLGAEFELVRDTKNCRQTAMLQLHGRQDDIMPPGGGVSGGFLPGWIYEPLQDLARVVSLFGYLFYVFLRLSMNQQNEDVLAFLHAQSFHCRLSRLPRNYATTSGVLTDAERVCGFMFGSFLISLQPVKEPLNKVQQGWAAVHDCDTVASSTQTYWDGGDKNLECFDYKGCTSGRRIMRCFYDGGHGDLPGDGTADQITLWFLMQYRLDGWNPQVVI
ncbi:unnamed protein product [Effrenium voratum]|nr:unnamed protein product [Effrenium voratum]